jgi:hypothetical protein
MHSKRNERREISDRNLKRSVRKGCKIYAVHLEEVEKDKVLSLEEFAVMGEFEYVFGEIRGFPPKREQLHYPKHLTG